MKNGIRTEQVAEQFGCVSYKCAEQSCTRVKIAIPETRIRMLSLTLPSVRLQDITGHEKLHLH
jgi:hypothetical protein